MQPVTHEPKRYVYECLGCNLLDVSDRSDKLTCSNRCRVRAHRNGDIRRLRELAAKGRVTPAGILQMNAAVRLVPALADRIMRDDITADEIRRVALAAFWKVYHAEHGQLPET